MPHLLKAPYSVTQTDLKAGAGGDGAASVRLRQGTSIVNERSTRSSASTRLDNLLRCAYHRGRGGGCQASRSAFRSCSPAFSPRFVAEIRREGGGTRRSLSLTSHSPEGMRRLG